MPVPAPPPGQPHSDLTARRGPDEAARLLIKCENAAVVDSTRWLLERLRRVAVHSGEQRCDDGQLVSLDDRMCVCVCVSGRRAGAGGLES